MPPDAPPRDDPPPTGEILGDRLSVFAHVTAEKAALYRAVMRTFVLAKRHFALHLRPREILRSLRSGGLEGAGEAGGALDGMLDLHEEGLEAALRQLCEWRNLERHVDTTDVATVADFYRPRYLYQLTPAGEAAERALEEFHRQIERPGELQTAALQDIQEHLRELLDLAQADEIDAGKADRNLTHLSSRFEELTARAQTFLSSLQRTIDLQGADVDEFLLYKELLIGYLERFIGELVVATANVASILGRLEDAGIERVIEAIARRRLADRMGADDAALARERKEWRARWQGLVAWFLGRDGSSQAEILRARARSAIPALLGAVSAIHDRRITRSDRTTDLRTLARWFAEMDDERDMHRLWHAAFGLGSSRHLRVDAATLQAFDQQDVSPRTSWLEAPPMVLTPRLRRTGRYRRPGRTAKVIDRSAEKRKLALLAAAERRQIDAARRALETDGKILLSELGRLDDEPFELLLDLLAQALARRVVPGQTVLASSTDGALEIVLEPLGTESTAVLETPAGDFSGLDHRIEIRSALGDAR